jgi:uncharacterized protein YjaZ
MKNLFILSALIFVGCTQHRSKNTDNYQPQPTVYASPKGDKIVFLDDYYLAFLKGVRAGNKNTDSLYRAVIQNPIMSTYFAKSEYSDLIKMGFYYPIQDTTGLANYISSIKSSEGKIEQLITKALSDANKILKNDSITVYVEPSNIYMRSMIQKMEGITAVTAGSKQIVITVDTNVSGWDEMLKYTIAHEFNHTYWTVKNFSKLDKFTLLNYLVFEGRADSYAHLIYPDFKCPWTAALMENEKTDLWNKIKPDLQSEDEMLERGVMFGSNTYPIWGGYTLGYSIVQSALKNHPELKPEEWASMDTQKILEMSDYK